MDRQQQDNTERPEWAQDSPRKRIAIPYSFSELMSWAKNNVFGPSHKFKDLTDFIPQKSTQNSITPKMKLGFLGDIMKMNHKGLEIGPAVIEFFKDVDYLVGNFEGTMIEGYDGKRIFLAQEHSENILTVLETLFPPEKFVLTNANNHAGDYGWSAFNKSYQLLKDRGFLTIGRKDEPSIMLDQKINVTSCTTISNQPETPYIVYLDEVDDLINPAAKFNILSNHWGYEMQLYPNLKQIELGKILLEKWDLVVGHHSHCPQPITTYNIYNTNKIIAYSLGDFSTKIKLKKYQHGMAVKIEVGPNDIGLWQVGEVKWKFTRVYKIDKNTFEVRLEDTCKYFKNNF
ncbi:MAG: CapA family protein [Candidatus Helarchaeota archaeon]|nr:CapA family protein [Candidatus Helarchaeota archaeon]